MKWTIELEGKSYQVTPQGHDISIHLVFDGPQPNTYGVDKARSAAYRSGGWVGDVREGGSCNFETIQLTPHCNGTHTECIGHITQARISVVKTLSETFFPAVVISVTPVAGMASGDGYLPAFGEADLVISRSVLEAALAGVPDAFCRAIVIRTLPNDDSKKSRDYMQHAPAFFTIDAMRYLVERGMEHLLTDLPSVDRLFDEGKLSAHHIFWGMEAGSHAPSDPTRSAATITEMVFVPAHVPDGRYLLNLSIAPFEADAAPSRPMLFSLHPTQS